MTQAQTLQDIYTKIADIYDKFCTLEGGASSDISTQLLSQLTINENTWVASTLTFGNPDNNAEITNAQTEVNELLSIALQVARDERISSDEVQTLGDGTIVPIPKGSPIMLLPFLIKILVLYKAPLKFLLNTIIDFIKDILLEHIKRKIFEKTGEFYGTVAIDKTSLIKIPNDAEKMTFTFYGMPNWIGKRFEPSDLNKSIISNNPNVLTDLSRYLGYKLGSVAFGFGLTGLGATDDIYWYDDIRFSYRKSVLDIPSLKDISNFKRFAYLYLELENTCFVSYFRKV